MAQDLDYKDNVGGLFKVDIEKIHLLESPKDFYSNIKSILSEAKNRIIISSLYIGNGALEQEIINLIDQTLTNKRIYVINNNKVNDLHVNIIVDFNRMQRNKKDMLILFESMLKKFPNNFKVYLFQLPIFNKYNQAELNRIAYKKNNIYNKIGNNIIKYFSSIEKFKLLKEVLGVYHMKFYIVDNNILITGANLSEEYLTTRQDRYILLRDVPEICDYLSKISDIVKEYSYTLKPDNKLQFPKKKDIYIMKENMLKLNKNINWLKDLIYSFERQHDEDFIKKYKDKVIFGILLQAGYMNINSEKNLVKYLINSCIKDIGLYICTPYCNMSKYWTNLIKFNSNPIVLVTTGRKSSTFSQFKEPIYLNILNYIKTLVIPIYSSINSEFIKDIIYNSNHKQREVEFGEYERDEWTFHAKGIYFYKYIKDTLKYKKELISSSIRNKDNETDYFPKHYGRRIFANYLGSSNYNHRSENRDLECSFLLLTNGNKKIQGNLNKEWYENIYRYLKRGNPLNIFNRPSFFTIFGRFIRSYL